MTLRAWLPDRLDPPVDPTAAQTPATAGANPGTRPAPTDTPTTAERSGHPEGRLMIRPQRQHLPGGRAGTAAAGLLLVSVAALTGTTLTAGAIMAVPDVQRGAAAPGTVIVDYAVSAGTAAAAVALLRHPRTWATHLVGVGLFAAAAGFNTHAIASAVRVAEVLAPPLAGLFRVLLPAVAATLVLLAVVAELAPAAAHRTAPPGTRRARRVRRARCRRRGRRGGRAAARRGRGAVPRCAHPRRRPGVPARRPAPPVPGRRARPVPPAARAAHRLAGGARRARHHRRPAVAGDPAGPHRTTSPSPMPRAPRPRAPLARSPCPCGPHS